MPEDSPDGIPDDMPIPKVPVDMQLIADVADQQGIDVTRLVEALEAIHDHVAQRARDLTERYTEEFGDDALIFQADLQQNLYVDPDEWDELRAELQLESSVFRAAKITHDRQPNRYADRLDRPVERVPELETNDVLVMVTPPIQDWVEAGLSLRQAYVQTLRTKGDTQERIGQKIGIATGTVKSHCDRIDRKIDQARQLVTLADEHGADSR